MAAAVIQPGDSGIWATCTKGREGKCVGELRDLFSEYAELLYGETLRAGEAGQQSHDGTDEANGGQSIESQIQAEIAGFRRPETAQLFTPVRLDLQCGTYSSYPWSCLAPAESVAANRADAIPVVFFKTASPVEPVSFVQRICEDAKQRRSLVRTRFAQRLTPMSAMGRASAEGLEKAAREVLAPHFHREPAQPRKVCAPSRMALPTVIQILASGRRGVSLTLPEAHQPYITDRGVDASSRFGPTSATTTP